MRWLIWSLFVIAWTVVLEIPGPSDETLGGAEFIVTNRILIAKTAHVAIYVFFTVLTAWIGVRARYRWLMMFFLMLHAWGSEMLQLALAPYCFRTGSLTDVGLDVIGIVIGVGLSWKWWTRESPSEPPA
jgi:hypothetical protein